MMRIFVVELIVDEETKKKLKLLYEFSSKLWDEVNHARLKMFFERKHIDFKGTWKEFYEKYKLIIGPATVQQILRRNDKMWRSFLRLLKLKREEGLPLFMKKVNPPGYKKKSKQKMLWVVFRNDQYTIENDRIIIKRLGVIGRIEVRYKGLIHLEGVEGSLEIRHDADSGKWYAHIPFKVFEKAIRGK